MGWVEATKATLTHFLLMTFPCVSRAPHSSHGEVITSCGEIMHHLHHL